MCGFHSKISLRVEFGMLTLLLETPSQKQCPGERKAGCPKEQDKNKGRRGKRKKKGKELAAVPGGIQRSKQRSRNSDSSPMQIMSKL
jgi:hypothetical protein